MLFLGLGTGRGSAMVEDGVLVPLELAHLPYRRGRTYEDYVGVRGLGRLGRIGDNRCAIRGGLRLWEPPVTIGV